tara:strand:- start:2441 stop:3085 length:645 start_codon:yes stop_codon:yes gene_type:complete
MPKFKKNKFYFGKKQKRMDDDDDDNDPNQMSYTESLISVNGNNIHFHCDITANTCFKLINSFNLAIKNIQAMDSINPTQYPIYLHINTDGGEVYKVLAVISHIKKLPYKVITICEGCVASAGVLLSLAGHERWIYDNAYMLVHEIRSGMWGKYSECIDDMYNNKKIMKDIKKYFKKETNDKFPEEIMEKILKRDILLNPKKCLKYGLVDKVISL